MGPKVIGRKAEAEPRLAPDELKTSRNTVSVSALKSPRSTETNLAPPVMSARSSGKTGDVPTPTPVMPAVPLTVLTSWSNPPPTAVKETLPSVYTAKGLTGRSSNVTTVRAAPAGPAHADNQCACQHHPTYPFHDHSSSIDCAQTLLRLKRTPAPAGLSDTFEQTSQPNATRFFYVPAPLSVSILHESAVGRQYSWMLACTAALSRAVPAGVAASQEGHLRVSRSA